MIEDQYNEDYFERGPVVGVSGYMNYGWMPEQTLRMAHFMIRDLPIAEGARIHDFGCAKGYLVKAMRILGVDAFGSDVSMYAISNVDAAVTDYCKLIRGTSDQSLFIPSYDLLIAKDVFEHIFEPDLAVLLVNARKSVRRIFAAIPLGVDNSSGKFVIPEYDKDVTHVLARTKPWWIDFFEQHGWQIHSFSYSFRGCKENWTSKWPYGNGFFQLESTAF